MQPVPENMNPAQGFVDLNGHQGPRLRGEEMALAALQKSTPTEKQQAFIDYHRALTLGLSGFDTLNLENYRVERPGSSSQLRVLKDLFAGPGQSIYLPEGAVIELAHELNGERKARPAYIFIPAGLLVTPVGKGLEFRDLFEHAEGRPSMLLNTNAGRPNGVWNPHRVDRHKANWVPHTLGNSPLAEASDLIQLERGDRCVRVYLKPESPIYSIYPHRHPLNSANDKAFINSSHFRSPGDRSDRGDLEKYVRSLLEHGKDESGTKLKEPLGNSRFVLLQSVAAPGIILGIRTEPALGITVVDLDREWKVERLLKSLGSNAKVYDLQFIVGLPKRTVNEGKVAILGCDNPLEFARLWRTLSVELAYLDMSGPA